jgi:uncharacterized protein YdaL
MILRYLFFFIFPSGAVAAGIDSACAKAIYETVKLIESESPTWYQSDNSYHDFTCSKSKTTIIVKFTGYYSEHIWELSNDTFKVISKNPDFKKRRRK